MKHLITSAILDAIESLSHLESPSPAAKPTQPLKPRTYEPLSAAAVALGKKAYLGPKRKRDRQFYLNRYIRKKVRKLY